jgi:hypothetical protein
VTLRDDIVLVDQIREMAAMIPKPRIAVVNPGVGEHFKASLSAAGVEYVEDSSCPLAKVYVIDPNELDGWADRWRRRDERRG